MVAAMVGVQTPQVRLPASCSRGRGGRDTPLPGFQRVDRVPQDQVLAAYVDGRTELVLPSR